MSYLLAVQNGTPGVLALGTDDQSGRTPPSVEDSIPTHLPKIYIYAEKGPITPQLVVGTSRTKLYGANSFDPMSKFFNHQSLLSNVVNAQGNAHMIERIQPEDSATATLRISIDVLESTKDLYERLADGSIVRDADGIPVKNGEVVEGGLTIRWKARQIPKVNGESTFAAGTMTVGEMVDEETGQQSVELPVIDLEVPTFGHHGNNNGIRLWTQTTKSRQPLDDRNLTKDKVYPFRIGCMQRATDTSTPKAVNNLSGEQSMEVTWKPGHVGSLYENQMGLGDIFEAAYNDTKNKALPPTYGPFGAIHVYDDHVRELLRMVYEAEVPFINTDLHDITGDIDNELYLINLLSATNSNGVPYYATEILHDGVDTLRPSENSAVMARGGADGTMNDDLFADLVAERVSGYADETSRLLDPFRNPESIIYDTGFKLSTKYALLNAQMYRKDIAVILGTHDVDGVTLTPSQDSSLGISLRTRAQAIPESDHFGTHVMRVMIMLRSGVMLNSKYTKRLPLTFEIAHKAARYMGASTGRWKPGLGFGRAPLNEISMMTDLSETFTPYSVRNKDWSNGLVWCESYKLRSAFIPALKTVYDDDTSVLNSFFTMMACVELQKVGHRAWAEHVGDDKLTNEEFADSVDKYIVKHTQGRFDDRFVIVPTTYYTENDKANGFSWHTKITIYAGSMKTVATISLEARRFEDLETA